MSENFPNPSDRGTPDSRQLALPVLTNAAPLLGKGCNGSRASAPLVSSTWLPPSASDTSLQPFMGSAHAYQHPSTTVLPALSGQSQISTSSVSHPGILEWENTRHTEKPSSALSARDSTVTVIPQDTAVSSMPTDTQNQHASGPNATVPLYPCPSAHLVQGTANQGRGFSHPQQEGSRGCYYNPGTLGPLLSGALIPCQQSHGSVSYTEGMASASQSEMAMVLKEAQPSNVLALDSTSAICYSISAQRITDLRFQVMETSFGMETSLRMQAPRQTYCISQMAEHSTYFTNRNIPVLESNTPSQLGGLPVTGTVESSHNLLALPPAPSQVQIENKSVEEIERELPTALEAYQIPGENQDPPLIPLEVPDTQQLLSFTDPLTQEEPSTSVNTDLGKNSLCLEDQGTPENSPESSSGFADTTTVVEKIHAPQLFISLEDLTQPKGLQAPKEKGSKVVTVIRVQEKSSLVNTSSDQARRNKRKASEAIPAGPEAQIQAKTTTVGEMFTGKPESSDRATMNPARHTNNKHHKVASSEMSKRKSHGQEKTKKTRENKFKQVEDSRQSLKAEGKPIIARRKRTTNQPELGPETLKKPRSFQGRHRLDSVQFFLSTGKSDQKTGPSSSRVLGKSRNTKEHRPPPPSKPPERKGPGKTHVKAHRRDGLPENHPSPSQDELPPPGKVKLVPLPFLTLDKPQALPASRRRPPTGASYRPSGAYPPGPGSTHSALPIRGNPPQPAPVSRKRMRPQPELGQETPKKPCSFEGRHRLDSVQFVPSTGKSDQKMGPPSSQALRKSSTTKEQHRPPPPIKSTEGKGPGKNHVKAHRRDGLPDKHPSPSQHELPPPGRVKLVPLPFLTLDKPQARPASRRRPPTGASYRPSGAYPPGPGSTHSALPIRGNPPQPAPVSRKRMRPQPELGQETPKKPCSFEGRHRLDSVQFFPSTGKSDQKMGPSSSQALRKSSTTKEQHRPPPPIKSTEGKGPGKNHVKAHRRDGLPDKHPSPSQHELPPPGRVKLVPLPFLTLDKPQARPASRRRPPTGASYRPSGAYPPGPGSTHSALPIRGNPPQPAPVNASATCPARPGQSSSTNLARPPVTYPTGTSVLQSAPSKPAASGTALQPKPGATVGPTFQPRPKPHTEYLLQDFSRQPIPWRKPDMPGPVVSTPIRKEQRPEWEAMKRKAQQEHENAVK